jgi:uroporphyrinogen-III decarboxylase
MPSERERFMAVMKGEPVDRIPWVARMEIWYNARLNTDTLPSEFEGCHLYDIHRRIGMGILGRYPLFQERLHDSVRVTTETDDRAIITTYQTPLGSVSTRDELAPRLKEMGVESPLRREFMIREDAHYDVVRYILEHTDYQPDYEGYQAYDDQIGDQGVTLAFVNRSPLQRMLIEIMGYEKTYFEMQDNPEKLAGLFELLMEKGRELIRIAVGSPAPLIWSPDNFHALITSPRLFHQYCVPYFQELSSAVHHAGKYLFSHADGEVSGLLELFVESGVDVIEAFSPAPMTRCTMAQARSVCGDKVKIWGGIPSAMLGEEFSEEDFEPFLRNIFSEAAPGDGFILGVGDNVMPESVFDRVRRVRHYVDKYAAYPITTG